MNSIRRQLTRRLLVVTLLLLTGGLLVLYLSARDAATDQFDATLRAKAMAISTLTRVTPDGVRVEFTDRFLRGFEEEHARDYFELRGPDGTVIARSESLLHRPDLPFRPGTPEHPAEWNLTLPGGRDGRAVAFTFRPRTVPPLPRHAAPELRLVVASNRGDLDETLWQLLALSGAWAVLLVGATVWVIPRVLRRGLEPLDRLGARAAQIDAESLATRFPLGQLPDELRPIAAGLNDLLGRLQASFERERRFSADLAHELRTPLAELRAATECALKWPDARDPATDAETLEVVRDMEAIVSQLLALARGEQDQLPVQRERIALASLVRDIWQRYADRADAAGLVVTLELADAEVVADPTLLRGILGNLFDNAVEYTPPAGRIDVRLESRATGACITVANTTAELGADDVPKLFDRFWRKETARTGGKHIGLGLSLARAFAETMAWKLSAAFDPAGQLVFTLASPAPDHPAGDAPSDRSAKIIPPPVMLR